MTHYSPPDGVELAKVSLVRLLSNRPHTLAEIYAYCKAVYPVKKSEIKQARKELGVVSRNEDGSQVWSLPK